MNNINTKEVINKYNLNINKIIIKNKYIILEGDNKYLLKVKDSNKKQLFNTLEEVDYEYFNNIINSYNDSYELYNYYEEKNIDIEVKEKILLQALILLELKTMYYIELDSNIKDKIYYKYKEKIEYLIGYYLDIQDYIEEFEFPRLDYYYLLLEISKINNILKLGIDKLNEWYNNSDKRMKCSILIQDLNIDNFIISKHPTFINWSKSYKDLILYDLVDYYKNNYNKIDILSMLKIYFKNISYTEYEIDLFIVLISIPDKIIFNNTNYNNILSINRVITYIEKTNEVINYLSKENEENKETD